MADEGGNPVNAARAGSLSRKGAFVLAVAVVVLAVLVMLMSATPWFGDPVAISTVVAACAAVLVGTVPLVRWILSLVPPGPVPPDGGVDTAAASARGPGRTTGPSGAEVHGPRNCIRTVNDRSLAGREVVIEYELEGRHRLRLIQTPKALGYSGTVTVEADDVTVLQLGLWRLSTGLTERVFAVGQRHQGKVVVKGLGLGYRLRIEVDGTEMLTEWQ